MPDTKWYRIIQQMETVLQNNFHVAPLCQSQIVSDGVYPKLNRACYLFTGSWILVILLLHLNMKYNFRMIGSDGG